MKLKAKILPTIAFFATTLSAPLAANCFDSCWGRSKPIEEELSLAEVEQVKELTDEKTPFELCEDAILQNDVEAFRENLALIEDVDATVDGISLIAMIALEGSVEQLEILLERDPKLNVFPGEEGSICTPLMLACVANTEVAKTLVLKAGADVNFFKQDSGNFTPLCSAILCGNLELVRFFIENGADLTIVSTINEEEHSFLALAIRSKNPEIEYLIRENIEVAEEVEAE